MMCIQPHNFVTNRKSDNELCRPESARSRLLKIKINLNFISSMGIQILKYQWKI